MARGAGRTGGRQPGGARLAVSTLLARASELHRAGDLRSSEALCREVLLSAPRNAPALHLLGLLLRETDRLGEAVESLRKAARLAPRDVVLLNNLGNLLKEQGALAEAEAVYTRVLAQRPDYHNARFNLGRTLQAMGDARRAVPCFRKLSQVAAADGGVWEALCAALLDAGQAEEAIAAGERAVAVAPELADAHNGLGLALADLGRFDEAAECYRRALALQPGFSKAALNLSKVRRYAALQVDVDDTALIESVSRAAGVGELERADTGFALGKIHDDRGEGEAAFAAYREANELRARHERFDAGAHAAWVDRLIETFTPALFERCRGLGRDDRQPLLIVGMPRSGTSLVEQILASHSAVHGAGELAVLQNLVNGLPAKRRGQPYPECIANIDRAALRGLADAYLEELRARGGATPRVSDKMPGNFLHLGLVAMALPGASIVHCRREPMDVGLSLYFHQFAAGHSYSWRLADIGSYIRQYQRLMRHWEAVLPRRALEVQYEQLVSEPERVARGMLEHCGLEWEPECLRFHDTRRAVHTASSWQVRQPIYQGSAQRWRRYEQHLGELRDALAAEGEG